MGKRTTNSEVFERIKYVKEILASATEGMSSLDIRGCLCHIWYYKLGRRKILTEKERQIYDLLLKNNQHPKSAYRWFLLEDIPESIKEKLKENKISLKDASSLNYAHKRMSATRLGKEIMDEMRTIMGGLKWNNQDNTL